MDDTAPKENPSPDFNKLDLSQLQSFSFGTQWTQDKQSSEGPERRERNDRPRRDDRRPAGGEARRDRRSFQRPAGAPAGAGDAPAPHQGGAPERREFSGDRRPRREFQGGPGGPRRDDGGERGPRSYPRGDAPMDRGPYDSPYFAVTFYPEDTSFNALAKTIRASCRTIELFEIARTVVGKDDRFVVVITRKPAADPAAPRQPIYVAVPDGLPFESDEATISHVMTNHLGQFFDTTEVEVDAPKGNYQVINKCGITGELLGPPNYHRYNQLVQQHYAAKISRMSPEAFRARIESVRDPEAVAQWLAKMKKVTRYTWKLAGAPVAPTPAAEPAAPEAPPAEGAPAAEPAPAAETAPAAPAGPSFDSLEEARVYLLTHARDKVVKTVDSARFHGRLGEQLPQGEIRRAIEGALERQRRFPLDTANALRGRLRREHFTIFKKGSKGISYVCAVKRKFRTPGQVFADSIGNLIAFIEAHPMVRASELSAKFLGIAVPKPAPAPAAATDGATAPAPAPAEPELTVEQREKIARMQGDLRWLVTEGYVTEFIDGRLFAPPPMVEARKKEVEAEEHDPENFPEIPPSNPPFAPKAEAAPATPATPATPVDAAPAPAPESPAPAVEPAPTADAAPAAESAPAAPEATDKPAQA
ncbi:MAG: hypothetical protein KF897_13995 [Opitutaceae bacterium]|nr:hypothetical protein [Opitutaceae bacterium]